MSHGQQHKNLIECKYSNKLRVFERGEIMILDGVKLIDVVEEIDNKLGLQLSNGRLGELEDVLIRNMIHIDITVYMEMYYLLGETSARVIEKEIAKTNLLVEEYDVRKIPEQIKVEIMKYLIWYINKTGAMEYVLKKIERDKEYEDDYLE